MARGTERHAYAGGNTGDGFHSFYDQIAPADARRVIILKGGPGVGKSTLMRQVGQHMQDQGYSVEYFHCSADINSLDGVRIPALEVTIMDGTAPHIVDPKYPGAVDEIIHLGDFWLEASIHNHKQQIMATSAAISRQYARAYRFLAAAKIVKQDTRALNREGFHVGRVNETAASLIQSIFGHRPVSTDVGRVRRLFASAITANGLLNHLDNLMTPLKHKYILLGSPGIGKSAVIDKVIGAAVERGFAVEAFHCALEPSRVEHVIIPALNVAVISADEWHMYAASDAISINFDQFRHVEAVKKNARNLAENAQLINDLLNRAIACLAEAKTLHDQLEEYYVPNMDFTGVETLRAQLIERILSYAPMTSVPAQ
jgi:nucleoside-triphosphatase THEP1